MSVIQLENVSKIYQAGENKVYALRKVNFSVENGEFVAIVGASGSGKTTMMNIVGCLDLPTAGSYKFNSVETTSLSDDDLARIRNEKIGFIFQSFNLLPRTTALENVMLPFLYSSHTPDYEKARLVLKRVGLGERLDHTPSQLSGGQQQRVAIARALINDPSIILADEPTGALDSVSSSEVLHILREINRSGATIVMVTHDRQVASYARRIVTMADGVIISDEKSREA